jgi:hypothetical protein
MIIILAAFYIFLNPVAKMEIELSVPPLPPPPPSMQPVISNMTIGGQKPSGTRSLTLLFNTDQDALCRLSTTSGVKFTDMTMVISEIPKLSHSYVFTNLLDGYSYDYHIRCNSNGNANYEDHIFSFFISDNAGYMNEPYDGYDDDTYDDSIADDTRFVFADLKSLIGQSSAIVEAVSSSEAEAVMNYGKNVDLNEATKNLYLSIAGKSQIALSTNEKQAIAYFIHHGTATTNILGAGERAGVLNSYFSVYGKLPRGTEEWKDAIKIANGRWPSERRESAEKKAESEIFKYVYKRPANMNNPNDNAAVTVITYGLRPASRNLNSEKAAANIFKGIYKRGPKSALDWDTVRAIAYSGAVR